MKVRLSFKTPDVVDDAVSAEQEAGSSEEEVEVLKRFLEKYISYGEYVTVEFDTVKGTAQAVPIFKRG